MVLSHDTYIMVKTIYHKVVLSVNILIFCIWILFKEDKRENVVTSFTGTKLSFWRRQWHPTPVLFPGKSHGWRSLVGYSPWGHKESDMTKWLHLPEQYSLVAQKVKRLPATWETWVWDLDLIPGLGRSPGEGNGNPLQCSCLKNPRDSGAWWAAVYGVAQSWTRLKQLSSRYYLPL